MIKTIVKALANAFDAIALIGLDSQVEKRSKKASKLWKEGYERSEAGTDGEEGESVWVRMQRG